jgi:hypothetical protein
VTLDEWSDDEVDAMIEVGGNASANSIYEAYIPEGYTKPGPDANHEQRSKFIRLDMLSFIYTVNYLQSASFILVPHENSISLITMK